MVKNKNNPLNPSNLIESIRFSIRITPKVVTSVSLKKNIVSMWLLMNLNLDYSKGKIIDFIYKGLNSWEKDTAKGFSDFITERMIKDILTEEDFIEYTKIKKSL